MKFAECEIPPFWHKVKMGNFIFARMYMIPPHMTAGARVSVFCLFLFLLVFFFCLLIFYPSSVVMYDTETQWFPGVQALIAA